MKLIQGILKLISFICGICAYLTVCLIALMGYGFITKKMMIYYPHLKHPDLLRVIAFIGIMSMVAFAYGRIKDEFFEPTMKVRITKKVIHDETLEN
jgi:hypothetical protein